MHVMKLQRRELKHFKHATGGSKHRKNVIYNINVENITQLIEEFERIFDEIR